MSPEGRGDRNGVAGEVFFELIRQGNAVKATAIDAATGTEASIVGPASAASSDLEALALAKLRRLLANSPERPVEPAPSPKPGRGIVI